MQVKNGGRKKGEQTINNIIDSCNAKFNLVKKKLTQSTVSRYVNNGNIEASPKVSGPTPKFPKSIFALIGTHASMLQTSTGEANPSEHESPLCLGAFTKNVPRAVATVHEGITG